MSQQNIDFGSFPDDPNADAIRTAFQKVQENFDEIYAAATVGTVTSVNGGAGITVNSPSGNVVVTARVSNVTLNTSTLRMGATPANSSLTASIANSSSQQITIDIDPANVFSNNFAANSTGGLANITGTLTTNANSQPNITSVGTLANLAVTANITAGNIYANAGTIGANLLIGTLTTASQPNITSVGTLTTLTISGNSNLGNVVTANKFSGDGSLLTNINVSAGSTILNGTSNINIISSGNVTTGVAGNANIVIVTGTGVNVTGYLNASGNITGANANLGNAVNANYFIGNFYGTANSATTAGTVTTNAQPNITSVGNLTSLTVVGNIDSGNVNATGNMSALNFIGNLVGNISGNIVVPGSNTEILFNNNGSANASNAFTFNKTSNVMTLTGNIIAGNIFANLGEIRATTFAGTLTTNAQPNITSVGNLTSLNVLGTSNLGIVSNVTITGGSANAFLMTNGSGTLTWNNGTLLPVQGTNSQVIFNDGGTTYAGNASLTFNKTTGALTATLLGGTLTTGPQPNITLLGTLSNLNVTGPSILNGNLNTANTSITGILTVTANIMSPQLISNVAIGTPPLVVTSTTQVANLNVATAGLATFATTANSVAGANVSGAVASATVAASANAVAGANVSGAVSFATTANAVAGANVSGAVSFATTANAVAGANVSGTVANATYAVSAGSVTNAVTFNNGGAGDVSGTTFNGGAARTVSYNSVGAPSTTGTNASGTWGINVTGSAGSAGSATTAGTVTTAAQPNITSVGTLTSLTTTIITTGASGTLGTITGNWSLSGGSQLRATYADLAEYYAGEANIEPGTVVEFGGKCEVQICNSYMSTLVAGIVTTNPAYIMNDGIECEYPVAIALQGRVPTKVIGPVKRGDMMVSANDGHAISCKSPSMGTVLGKALTDFNGEIGMIEIMVGRT